MRPGHGVPAVQAPAEQESNHLMRPGHGVPAVRAPAEQELPDWVMTDGVIKPTAALSLHPGLLTNLHATSKLLWLLCVDLLLELTTIILSRQEAR